MLPSEIGLRARGLADGGDVPVAEPSVLGCRPPSTEPPSLEAPPPPWAWPSFRRRLLLGSEVGALSCAAEARTPPVNAVTAAAEVSPVMRRCCCCCFKAAALAASPSAPAGKFPGHMPWLADKLDSAAPADKTRVESGTH
jgi:hypothetical protein